MGKDWDHGIPGVDYWKEALRICKPGAFLLSFGGTKTFHRLTCAIEDAEWEIIDCLMWLYGSGFPKSKGSLKPAWEPIIMARKKGAVGKINIDKCRIFSEYSKSERRFSQTGCGFWNKGNSRAKEQGEPRHNPKGRWPANLLLDEDAAKMLDEQSGILKSGSGDKHSKTQDGTIFNLNPISHLHYYKSDTGGASRFFYCAKASPSERGEGNIHPTVKPLKLIEYLIKLIMLPKDGVLLDPFVGSGTTLIAAHNLGYEAIGIEKEEKYYEIAEKRVRLHSGEEIVKADVEGKEAQEQVEKIAPTV